MTIEQKKKVLERIVQLQHDIEELKKARLEVGLSGYSSATLASSGGSKSFTRMDLEKITGLIGEMMKELSNLRDLLAGGRANISKQIYQVYI